jgi:hypothetical protein
LPPTFSVEEQITNTLLAERPARDGALYALSPYLLNHNQVSRDALVLPSDSLAKEAVRSAFQAGAQDVDYVVAVMPAEVDIRITAQQSTSTVHPPGYPLETIADPDEWLIKFSIPMSSKEMIRDDLKRLGIHESVLFPDLQHLAHEVKGLRFADPLHPQSDGRPWPDFDALGRDSLSST